MWRKKLPVALTVDGMLIDDVYVDRRMMAVKRNSSILLLPIMKKEGWFTKLLDKLKATW